MADPDRTLFAQVWPSIVIGLVIAAAVRYLFPQLDRMLAGEDLDDGT